MSFGLPSLKPQAEVPVSFLDGKVDNGSILPSRPGLRALKGSIEAYHPLQLSEKNYEKNADRLNMMMLRNVQGIHAPLRLAAELKATESIGRLPFLESSDLARATLKGSDDFLDFTDMLNPRHLDERMVNPHRCMENKIGIL